MQNIEKILEDFKEDRVALTDVLTFLRKLPYENLSFARVDHHRSLRRGFPEVVYGEAKSSEEIAAIARAMKSFGSDILVTRVDTRKAEEVMTAVDGMVYHATARMLSLRQDRERSAAEEEAGPVHVLCAGSSDTPVAEEAAVTAEFMGNKVQRFYDVGVAGLHRLIEIWDELRTGSVYVVVAGMEGALPSVVGGLVEGPVIAVPTSVGYGASFGGVAALLGMLNSCAPGVAVVNIDNGFGAGYLASVINRSRSARNHGNRNARP